MVIRIPAHKPYVPKNYSTRPTHKSQQTIPVIRIPATKSKEHHESEPLLDVLATLWESFDDDLPPEYRMASYR